MKFIYIAIGGACGSVCRYILSEYVSTKYTTNFPLGTLLVNTIGSLIIGFLFGFFSINGEVNDRLKFLVFIGFLGGFTTFSSYALEN
ncbi:MAG TPA: fluoride efflux transporter CrcB, partial [Chitinophagales bacterium]|nr:fluoride efflux transporter CrcB [Chitinophagales bacterium]